MDAQKPASVRTLPGGVHPTPTSPSAHPGGLVPRPPRGPGRREGLCMNCQPPLYSDLDYSLSRIGGYFSLLLQAGTLQQCRD